MCILTNLDLTINNDQTIQVWLKFSTKISLTLRQKIFQWSRENNDAHEALDKDDFCLASYDAENRLIINND